MVLGLGHNSPNPISSLIPSIPEIEVSGVYNPP